MSNWSLLFLVVALIAALFSFGFLDSAVAGGALIVFAFAIVFFLATSVADGIQRHESLARKRDCSAGGDGGEKERPSAADHEGVARAPRGSESSRGTNARATRQDSFSDVA